MSFSGYQTLLKDPVNKSEYSNGRKKGYFTCSAQTMLPAFASITRDCMLTPSDKHLTTNTQSRHGGYKMQVTMTISNWDLILNPFTRAFYTDYVGELKKVFQQKIVFARF